MEGIIIMCLLLSIPILFSIVVVLYGFLEFCEKISYKIASNLDNKDLQYPSRKSKVRKFFKKLLD